MTRKHSNRLGNNMPPREERIAGFPHLIEEPLCIKGPRGSHPEEPKKIQENEKIHSLTALND